MPNGSSTSCRTTSFQLPELVSIRDVLRFVRSGETIYHDSQVKTPVLKPMEKQDLLRVKEGTRKKRYTYPDGCRIRFEPRLQGTLQV